ncbi:type II toxin-antitoxin system Phd/YefM family antitoxin [Gluconobacter wancherniae]|uniref:type II toxin-antitoxin system Phd/YefM family antitoxin n=1 Tax=Gluconobacter wancherniae TaxID=1307955 RepID=UPI001B8AEC1C|nr:type II toxin-antitoxin system Phd/YefM family antitoxin [Gluconobacter wancherniae]MBS1064286.1 type II toxin-antitoxin system Phd/YefM family antitoxin [Gluconobacter wancherniae]
MQILTYSDARARLKELMERVSEEHQEVVITRKNGKPVVMVSLEDWNALQETARLLAVPENVEILARSIMQLEADMKPVREGRCT